MSYTLLAGSSNGLALVSHPDGGVFRYNFGRPDGIIFYQNADHLEAFNPGDNLLWDYYGRKFDTLDSLRVWWTYNRTGSG
ncbi:hypothetical protein [Mycobacterium phage MS810]|uniref:Uncharacterized protein n=3 Tax=Faithunavirus TaxID=2948705 RepID=F6M888_9CAUD|nr:hypothetical protein SEA_FAITH1_93 [Mycobacterium phage Faith1]YP_008410968.1 hypothetical protein N848_gp093 [Mycobacterium phage Crossroads]YP_009017314.1 hypothetical protein CL57_gp089 [Mycobacterium phage Rumpelstiltskin]YP_009292606.1 hypothetical protein BI025_gp090 [Mycobacterium phage Gardann]YP_010013059.1 hypothetical protein J4T97_gp090 [Mycobacterium phage GuuelaD]AGK87656.1 hypothetical protein PBI_WINKY_93 [Mycobacterium phage Winky]AGM12702.1 hypothetical protein PBI_BREEZO